MNIYNYIIRGGENLNSAPNIVGAFSPEAQNAFEHWHVNLSQDDEEKETYIECPVDNNNRLFIRAFWYEPSGQRPVCYYVGLLVPRSFYLEVGEYYKVNKGLCEIPLSEIRRAAAVKAPIEINTEWPLLRSTIGRSFEALANWKKFGEKDYNSNIIELLYSISVNNIDDWFSRLILAVNPECFDSSYHVVISKRRPITFRKTIAEHQFSFSKSDCYVENKRQVYSSGLTEGFQIKPQPTVFTTNDLNTRDNTFKETTMRRSQIGFSRKVIIAISIVWFFGIVIGLLVSSVHYGNKIGTKDEAYSKETKELHEQIKKLRQSIENIEILYKQAAESKMILQEKYNELDKKEKDLKEENAKLKEKLSHYETL